jgi:inner membrane protein
MIEGLIYERQLRQQEAGSEVSSKWGEKQTLTGIVLTLPFTSYSKVYESDKKEQYKIVESKEYLHFLPEELSVDGQVFPEIRYRGIYEIIVYNSKVKLRGRFKMPDLEKFKIDTGSIHWDEAFISLGISDLRSVKDDIVLIWNNQRYPFNPGVETNDIIQTGISARVPVRFTEAGKELADFSLDLDFNGSTSLNFIPLGKQTNVHIKSKWQSPSFIGAFLPDKREVNENGFTATWKVLHLNRPYPQSFKGSVKGIEESAFGLSLLIPVDEYQKSMRSAKYAVMFITLTFLIFFFMQILNGTKIHPIQYIIVGLALCVFYTLLIALSEYIAFTNAYLISSIAIVGLITLYSISIFRSKRLIALISFILSALYVFIYSIIQMEDFALLIGSIGLFVILAIIMFLSRKIDWYAIKTNPQD